MHTVGTWWMWVGFFVFVFLVLATDMFVLGGKRAHRVSTREALTWTLVWFSCAMIFNYFLWWYLKENYSLRIANQKGLEFFTGYLIEESLSIDNMFVFIMIFSYFSVPAENQRRVLLYGVFGAIVMRLLMILLGTWLVSRMHWILYVFGAFLVFSGIKMIFFAKDKNDLSQNILLIWLRKNLRITEEYHQDHFFIRQNRYWYATPLFLVLVFIELSDLIFALDSIPAIFAITNDPFIVFTSNIFAIMGLRALYFLLANMAGKFYLLKYGIALMLTFIGVKMLIAPWIKIPILIALSIVIAILVTTIILSLLLPRKIEGKKWKKFKNPNSKNI